MSYSIIGFGAVGQALARAFARQHIEVTVASRRAPEALASQARAIGESVLPATLPAALPAADPHVKGGRRVMFLASDNDSAVPSVAALAEQLGFAPVWLGKLGEGGALVQARGRDWDR